MKRAAATAPPSWSPIIIAALAPTVAAALYIHAADSTSLVQIIYFSSKALIFSFPAMWWLIVERRTRAVSFSSRGFAGGEIVVKVEHPRELKSKIPILSGLTARGDIALGVGSGALIGASLWCMYLVIFRGVIDADALAERVRRFGMYEHYLLYTMFLSIINSGLEEYYWRWFVFGRLRAKVGAGSAVVPASVAFAAHHFVVLNDFLGSAALAGLFSVGIAVGGAMWAWHYHLTGRLRGVWVSHCLVDIAALSIGYHILF